VHVRTIRVADSYGRGSSGAVNAISAGTLPPLMVLLSSLVPMLLDDLKDKKFCAERFSAH